MIKRIFTFATCAVVAGFAAGIFAGGIFQAALAADGQAGEKIITVRLALGKDGDRKRLFHPQSLTFQRGKRYRLVIHNPILEVHEFDSPGLVEAVWSSHVKVLDGYGAGSRTVAIIVGTPAEIEIVPGASVEWEFVPVAAGRYEMVCDTLDQSAKTHAAGGMTGSILVE